MHCYVYLQEGLHEKCAVATGMCGTSDAFVKDLWRVKGPIHPKLNCAV